MVSEEEASLESLWGLATACCSTALRGGDAGPLKQDWALLLQRPLAAELLREWLFAEMEASVLPDGAAAFADALRMRAPLADILRIACAVLRPPKELCAALDAASAPHRASSPGPRPLAAKNPTEARFRRLFDNYLLLRDVRRLKEFRALVTNFLKKDFAAHQASRAATDDDDEDSEAEDDEVEEVELDVLEEDEDGHGLTIAVFTRRLIELEWFDLLEEPLSDLLCDEIEKNIKKVCGGNFEQRLLGKVCAWLESIALNWLRTLLNGCISNENTKEEKFAQYRARLEFHVFETLCELRMSELFEIITDYPDSSSALGDLKDCLARTHQHRELVSRLRFIFASRLLHPGAQTALILDVYVASIKSLRLLDPTGVLLEAVSEPIKTYLRDREDAIRSIVTSLTDGSNSDLFEDFGDNDEMKPITQGYDESDEEDNEDDPEKANHEEWTPDPIEADPTKTSKSRRNNDILSMLVHIYGSKELFVNEYRLMLADKLLIAVEFDAEKEVRNLELLKLRFGEGSMQNCEIMVKDIEESKRINVNISKRLSSKASSSGAGNIEVEDIGVTIVSKQFWPTLHGEDIKPHPEIQRRMDAFSREYSILKNPRQLSWKTNLGIVELELEFDDGASKNFSVNPFLATLVMHFGDRETWTDKELADATESDVDAIRKRMNYWVNQGVVRLEKSAQDICKYHAVDVLSDDFQAQGSSMEEDEGVEKAVSADAQLAAEMKVYESFVRGMLNNYESLPLERIHNMLKMFVSTGEHKYEKNEAELRSFLDTLVKNEVLEIKNGNQYALIKN